MTVKRLGLYPNNDRINFLCIDTVVVFVIFVITGIVIARKLKVKVDVILNYTNTKLTFQMFQNHSFSDCWNNLKENYQCDDHQNEM